MYCILIADDYCSEEIYKCLSMNSHNQVIMGISEYDFSFRKSIFEKLFDSLTVVCCHSESDYADLLDTYSESEVIISGNLMRSLKTLDGFNSHKSSVCSMEDYLLNYNCHTNRLTFRKRKSVKEILDEKNFVRVIETNCGLSSMLLQQIEERSSENEIIKYDAFWMSSLCDSLHRGKPDHEITDLTDRLNSFSWTQEISSLPVMFDLDSGGTTEHFLDSLITLYNRGVSAVVIEDKVGNKINSLSDKCNMQPQDSAEHFAKKISCGRKLINDDDFMIIARIESLNVGNSIEEAIMRSKKYIEANADAILIHYNRSNFNIVKEFCMEYNRLPVRKPVAVIPTKYSYVTEDELKKWGVNIVIYANQVTRSIVPAILNTGSTILKTGRALEASLNCISVSETLRLVDNDISKIQG